MIDLQTAIQISTEAHKGQWRKPTHITNKQYTDNRQQLDKWLASDDENPIILPTGEKVSWDDLNDIILIQEPYITHPLAVMDMMSTETEKILAVLHDVVEDCKGYGLGRRADNSYFYLVTQHNGYREQIEIPVYIYNGLSILTHDPDVPYLVYIKGISKNRLTTKVKIGDITHNMSSNPSDKAKAKYLMSIPILLEAL